ncbi:UDP-glycosyltransferase 85A4 [Arabidopsis thaliana]|uniref:Glycosyltransferase n=2 Tax=Arabidopsis TaxID=3701 RepID=A0A178W4L2_ARATH|nr:UDP-glucuronosyl/UDP-glucosyltransferase [Arabidopsis thaliana x Arabidopsis arenosa]OAP13096.1 UGT85A4 [Arabidopsis thaliana]
MEQHGGSSSQKRHAVCIPYPAQGHINPMLKVAKLLHARGFHVTFVNTDYNHRRILQSRGPHALNGLPSFRFETIPDGLPWTDVDAKQDMLKLIDSTINNCLAPFKDLILRLNSGSDIPPVSCIISDASTSFTIDAAEELKIPVVLLWTNSATALILYLHYQKLIEKEIIPLKDSSDLKKHLETEIDWIPSMKNIKLKDFPDFVTTTDPQDPMISFILHVNGRIKRASAIFINTFEKLEHNVLLSLRSLLPQIYSVGPFQILENREIDKNSEIRKLGLNLWEEETESLDWLDTKAEKTVIYVNFGSLTVLTSEQILEFAWGLARSGKEFLWVVRSGLVDGDDSILPAEFLSETKNRGLLITGWCSQEKVLTHPAIGGFFTHCGWNSTLESLYAGVPMICWPFFADQLTNRKFCCDVWGIGMEIGKEVKRDRVETVVKELMDGEKGKRLREMVMEWRRLAEEASAPPLGSSSVNFETVVNKVLTGHTIRST